MINYSTIKKLCADRGLTVTELAERVGFTIIGFKKSIDNQRIGACYIERICEELNLTPNEFFGITEQSLAERVAKIEQKLAALKLL